MSTELPRKKSGKRSAGLLLPAVATLIALTILLVLGFWQVQRLHWKNELIDRVNQRIEDQPVSLSEILEEFGSDASAEYRPVLLSGTFYHPGERHYYTTHRGEVGWNIFTPLIRDDGSIVMVNRGFVPDALKNPDKRKDSQFATRVTIEGLLRVSPEKKPNMFMPDNEPAANRFYWRDLSQMIESSGVTNEERAIGFFVDVRKSDKQSDYPIAGTTRVRFPNSHLQYAGTWFGLAFVLACVFVVFARQRLKANQTESDIHRG